MTPRSSASFSALLASVVALGIAYAAHGGDTAIRPNGFRAMIGDAVAHMHVAMDVPFSGDVDRDFARMMIPHHQGAIDMAQAELRYGHNELLRRMAQEIIVGQQQEIAAMQLAVGQPLPPSVAAPDQPSDLSAPTAPPASMPMMNMQPPQKEP